MQNDRLYGILSYLGILVLIPIFKKENEFQHFHAEQGLTLYLFSTALLNIVQIIPIIGTFLSIALCLADLVFVILGIVSVCQNKMSELPLIGKFKFLK